MDTCILAGQRGVDRRCDLGLGLGLLLGVVVLPVFFLTVLRRLQTVSLHRTDSDGEELEMVVVDLDKDPLGHLENRALADEMRHAIDSLRPEYRELVLLRHFAGLSYQDIADFKEMPLGTVKNKLFRAHSVLRTALATFISGESRET